MITFLVLAFYVVLCIACGIAVAAVDDTNDVSRHQHGGQSAEAPHGAKEDAS